MAEINTTVTSEQVQMEQGLQFGPDVTLRFEPNFPTDNIEAANVYNHRLAGGMVIAGVKVDKDLRNIRGLVGDIKQLGMVKEPLLLSEREDGKFILLQGFRRYNATMTIRSDEPTSPLAHKLKYLPCRIYKNLTPQQERDLVNDQTSKDFSRAEVYNIFREQIEGGFNWKNVCLRMYQQIGRISGPRGIQKIREIDNITDPQKREKELTDWLNSFAFQFWHNSIKAGRKIADLVMQTHMYEDGALTTRPKVLMSIIRMKKLQSAIVRDTADGKYNLKESSGPNTDSMLAAFAEEDRKEFDPTEEEKNAAKVKREKKLKLRPGAEVDDLIQTAEGENPGGLVSRILKIVLVGGGDPNVLREVHRYDRCKQVFELHRSYLDKDVRQLMELIFNGGGDAPDLFGKFLEENYAPETPSGETPEPETPTGETASPEPESPTGETPTAEEEVTDNPEEAGMPMVDPELTPAEVESFARIDDTLSEFHPEPERTPSGKVKKGRKVK